VLFVARARVYTACMTLAFALEREPRLFEERTRAFLVADPVRHTLPLGVLSAVTRGLYAEWLLASSERAGEVTAIAICTPPHDLIVAASELPALELLAQGLHAHGATFPGVVGLAPWVHEFAASWSAKRGAPVQVAMRQSLLRLDRLVAPQPAAGRSRPADRDDRELLVDWHEAFMEEAQVPLGSSLHEMVARGIATGRFSLWQDGPTPTSFLARTYTFERHARIGPVYTPPEHRGHGYASNLVAHVSAEILRDGVPALFTDQANATSNALYEALGYTFVSDAAMVSFGAP
jgi:predicted GNAT family acetyltransferase